MRPALPDPAPHRAPAAPGSTHARRAWATRASLGHTWVENGASGPILGRLRPSPSARATAEGPGTASGGWGEASATILQWGISYTLAHPIGMTMPSEEPERAQDEPDIPALSPERLAHLNRLSRRAAGLFIDWLVFVMTIDCWLEYGLANLPLGETITIPIDDARMPPLLEIVVRMAVFISLRDLDPRGSPGRRIMGLRLVRCAAGPEPAQTPSYGRRLLRNCTLLNPICFMIEFVVAHFDLPRQRRLGDRWANTLVVEGPRAKPVKDSGRLLLAGIFVAWVGLQNYGVTDFVYQAWAYVFDAVGLPGGR